MGNVASFKILQNVKDQNLEIKYGISSLLDHSFSLPLTLFKDKVQQKELIKQEIEVNLNSEDCQILYTFFKQALLDQLMEEKDHQINFLDSSFKIERIDVIDSFYVSAFKISVRSQNVTQNFFLADDNLSAFANVFYDLHKNLLIKERALKAKLLKEKKLEEKMKAKEEYYDLLEEF